VSSNFVSGDYDRKAGLKGNGTTKYLDTNYNNNADPQNDKHYSVLVHTLHTSGTAGTYIGSQTRTNGAAGVLRSGGTPTNNQFRCHDNTGSNVAGGSTAGFLGASRTAAGSYAFRSSGTTGTISAASQTPATGTMWVFRGLDFWSAGRIQFYSIGSALTLADLETRITNLVADLDAAI
jgi:hypothetical protein